MRPISLVVGLLFLIAGIFFFFELTQVPSYANQVAGFLGFGGMVGGAYILPAGLVLIGFVLTGYGLTTPKAKLTVDEIRKLGLTGDNIRPTPAVQTPSQTTVNVVQTPQTVPQGVVKFCPSCGAQLLFSDKTFCQSCGFRLIP